uniref:Uncharacterized protein n=1 Tax=Panagrolaimus sp. JU765 TaxID=591449 RepID=A0AC34QMK3_9BILA
MFQIWGKLRKLRKVFIKNHQEIESGTNESIEIEEKKSNTQGSRYCKPTAEETECVEEQEDPKFNLSGLRRRLEEPPFLRELSGQTGNKRGGVSMFQNGKSPPEFEPERPPRPQPPRPEIVEDEDSDDAASVSSEERAPVVVPLPPRALLPLMDPTQLLRLPHHFALREKFAEVFSADEISGVPLQRLLEVRRYIQSITNVDAFFDAIPLAQMTHLSINIVDTILHLVDDLDEVNDTILKHVRQYLNFLFTCGNKSAKFRSTFEKHSAFHWLGMLRFPPIKNDIIYSLNFFTDTLVLLYTDDNFVLWIVDVIGCFVGFHDNADQRQYIVAYVLKLAQLFPCFLYRCYDNMSRTNFDDLLLALEKGIKTCLKWEANKGEYGGPPILKSAVYYLIKFFDMSIDDFKDETLDWHFLFSRIISLMDSISYVIKNICCYREIFREVPALMHNVCQLQNIIVTGDEILKENRINHNIQQQVVRRQGITANRPFPSRKTISTSGILSDERADDEGLARSKMVSHDGPPERKYARRSVEHELMENHSLTSAMLYPLPSVEILEFDVNTGFRSRESLLNLYRTRRISPVYIVNMKKAILRLIGSLCVAVPEYKDIASEYGIVDSTFKSTKVGDSIKGDYLVVARSALVEICTDHEKNLQSLKDIEPSPSHLLAKHDVMDRLMIANGDSH